MNFDELEIQCDDFCKTAADKDYQRNYMRNRYHKIRQQAIKDLGGACVDCGAADDLQFDHKDKKKKELSLSRINSLSKEKLQKELAKCQLLCRKCHKDKTHKAWDYSTPKAKHGTEWMYRKYKCRCNKCVKAHKKSIQNCSDQRRERRKKLRELAA